MNRQSICHGLLFGPTMKVGDKIVQKKPQCQIEETHSSWTSNLLWFKHLHLPTTCLNQKTTGKYEFGRQEKIIYAFKYVLILGQRPRKYYYCNEMKEKAKYEITK